MKEKSRQLLYLHLSSHQQTGGRHTVALFFSLCEHTLQVKQIPADVTADGVTLLQRRRDQLVLEPKGSCCAC